LSEKNSKLENKARIIEIIIQNWRIPNLESPFISSVGENLINSLLRYRLPKLVNIETKTKDKAKTKIKA